MFLGGQSEEGLTARMSFIHVFLVSIPKSEQYLCCHASTPQSLRPAPNNGRTRWTSASVFLLPIRLQLHWILQFHWSKVWFLNLVVSTNRGQYRVPQAITVFIATGLRDEAVKALHKPLNWIPCCVCDLPKHWWYELSLREPTDVSVISSQFQHHINYWQRWYIH